MASQPDYLIIIPGEGRWVWEKAMQRLSFYDFGATHGPLHQEDQTTRQPHTTRTQAILRALTLEKKRQRGTL